MRGAVQDLLPRAARLLCQSELKGCAQLQPSTSALLQQARQAAGQLQCLAAELRCGLTSFSRLQHIHLHREHGGGVPEFWGRESKYTAGTNFLGTPTDHFEVSKCSAALCHCCGLALLFVLDTVRAKHHCVGADAR